MSDRRGPVRSPAQHRNDMDHAPRAPPRFAAAHGDGHVIGATAAIAAGNLVAIVAGHATEASRTINRAGIALGSLGFLSATLLMFHLALPDGIWERGSVYTFFAWQIMTGISLLRAHLALLRCRVLSGSPPPPQARQGGSAGRPQWGARPRDRATSEHVI